MGKLRVLLASVSRSRVQRGFTPERDSEFHFMLQKAIVRSALSRTHTKPRRTCRTTLAFHQFIRPARSLGDRNLSQSSHRKARFLNRIRPQGWLAPSLQHRVDTTLTWVNRISHYAAVSSLVQELVRFDLQLMQNP
jgi:hypothetical protein